MKILRVRKGFTTNSSGDNEFFPPAPPPTPIWRTGDASPDGGRTDAGPGDAAPVHRHDAAPDAQPRDGVPHEHHDAAPEASPGDAGQPAATTTQPDASPAPPANSGAWPGGASAVGWIVLGVAGLFVAERAIRSLLRRLKKPPPPGEDGTGEV